jgi:Tfp pilus assembly protein PilX
MGTTMDHQPCQHTPDGGGRERGAAIIIALMVSLVLAFLGLGLLLQTSLGLQAAGTDRWVVRALYAADAGTQLEIATLSTGAVGQGAFVLADDTSLAGFLTGQFNVTVSDVCELQPPSEAVDPATGVVWDTTFRARHFFFRSAAQRDAGVLVGLTRAAITQDVTVMPIPIDQIFPAMTCY